MKSVVIVVRTLLGGLLAFGAAARGGVEERWHIVEMMGAKAGWLRSTSETRPDGAIVSQSEMSFRIGRGSALVGIRVESEIVETADGRPVSMRVEQEFGAAPVIVEYDFRDDHVLVRTTQAGRTTETRESLPPADALLPGAAERETLRRIEAGEREITLRLLDATAGLTAIDVTRTLRGEGPVEALGKTVAATEWEVTQSIYPDVKSVEWLDLDGQLVRGTMDLGGIEMTILASEKELALADAPPPEIMRSTLITPDRRIEHPRGVRSAEYTLSVADGALPDMPTAGAQRFERRTERSGVVVVDAARVDRVDEAFDARPYLEASQMIDGEDPEVKRIGAVGETEDPAARAETLRNAVHRHIDRKSLDVGLASASDVARTRQGDCTEHAVLLAAALRSAGIPSRVVSGAVYIDEFMGEDGVFGYHMWTQALLPVGDGTRAWRDLDATLGPDQPFDAAHIAMNVSALGDGEMINSLAALAPLMGRLKVGVTSASNDHQPRP